MHLVTGRVIKFFGIAESALRSLSITGLQSREESRRIARFHEVDTTLTQIDRSITIGVKRRCTSKYFSKHIDARKRDLISIALPMSSLWLKPMDARALVLQLNIAVTILAVSPLFLSPVPSSGIEPTSVGAREQVRKYDYSWVWFPIMPPG